MGTGEIVTSIVALLAAVGAIALMLDARRKRRQAAANQKHSNVKPLGTHDRAELIQKGGLGGDQPGM
jgi:hypothetical protein